MPFVTLCAALLELLFCVYQSSNNPLREWLLNLLQPARNIPVRDSHSVKSTFNRVSIKMKVAFLQTFGSPCYFFVMKYSGTRSHTRPHLHMGGCNRCVCIQCQCLKKRGHLSTHHFCSANMDLKVAAVAVCLCAFFVTSTKGNYQDQGDTCEDISAHSERFRSRQKVQCVTVCVLQRCFIEIEVLLTFYVCVTAKS